MAFYFYSFLTYFIFKCIVEMSIANAMRNVLKSKEHKSLIKHLRETRLDNNMTQEKVAGRLKMTQSYISKIETGKRRVGMRELKKLAKIYNKQIIFFIKYL